MNVFEIITHRKILGTIQILCSLISTFHMLSQLEVMKKYFEKVNLKHRLLLLKAFYYLIHISGTIARLDEIEVDIPACEGLLGGSTTIELFNLQRHHPNRHHQVHQLISSQVIDSRHLVVCVCIVLWVLWCPLPALNPFSGYSQKRIIEKVGHDFCILYFWIFMFYSSLSLSSSCS